MVTFVSFATGLRPTEIISNRRRADQAHARFAIMWAAKRLTTYSYPQIAHFLGGFDHTSIMHGCRRAEELRDKDPDFKALTEALLLYFTEDTNPEEADPCLSL
jgi:chromosomal replication initiator protein